jgi:DNA polymerase I
MKQEVLFEHSPVYDWAPQSPPDLSAFPVISLDTETTGLDKDKDKPVGISFCTTSGLCQYLPFGHAGGNLDKATVVEWARKELRDKYIVGANISYDARMLRNIGVDLEAQGCRLHDIQHDAALLDEYRRSFSLESMGQDFVGRGKKVLNSAGVKIDVGGMAKHHSGFVGPYAEEDARLTLDVYNALAPKIVAEGLDKVQRLEDDLQWVNISIETNGARLDVGKLEKWRKEVRKQLEDELLTLRTSGGSKIPFGFTPNSSKKWAALFRNLELPERLLDEEEGYTADFLKTVKDPIVQRAFHIKRLQSMLSKYLDKYSEGRDAKTGIPHMYGDLLRFNLFPLRNDTEGTVSGRYSSANVNVQQVMSVEKQIKEMGDEHIIRELFIPDSGYSFFACDASQIEFRLFAHYSGDKALQAAYSTDPKTDFYLAVAAITGQSRSHAKITSLGKLYCMGLEKLAGNLGLNCKCGVGLACHCKLAENGWEHKLTCGRRPETHMPDCPALQAMSVAKQYDEKFPAAKALSKLASNTAKERGFVTTLLGRRQRFNGTRGIHSALNRIIQGSAADLFKTKLLNVYRERKTLGIHKLRMPVHDEATGDFDLTCAGKLQEFFNQQDFDLKVPIRWELGYGENWRDCK